MSHRKELDSAEDILLNRTVEEEYVSELQKRNTDSSNRGPPAKSTAMKKFLLIAYGIVAIIGIILIIVALSNRNGSNIENKQETNMYKVLSVETTLQKVTVELESKDKKNSETNDDTPR